jgi:hypothetical protein
MVTTMIITTATSKNLLTEVSSTPAVGVKYIVKWMWRCHTMSKQSTLSDCGGGAEDPSPEDSVKINLSKWFESHGADVYWEKRPSYGYQVFQTDGGTDHPDLLIDGRYRTFAIEVKRGRSGADIHSGAAQTHRYWLDYVLNNRQYRLADVPVNLDAFVLATKYTPDGHLFYRQGVRDPVRDRHVEVRMEDQQVDPPIHWLPDWEFTGTESVTRTLWYFSKDSVTEQQADEIDAGVGTLLSSRLDGSQPDQLAPEETEPFERSSMPEPKALYRTFGEGNGIATHNWRWVQ